MANIREIKHRINSIKETRQITKAMQLISAAKLKRARQQLESTLPFFEKVKVTMADIITHSGEINNPYFIERETKENRKKGFILLTGDKGLAGGYNHNIIKLAEQNLEESPDALLFIAGQVGRSYFGKKNYNIYSDFGYPVQSPTIYRAREITELILEFFNNDKLDEVYVIYTQMQSSINLEPHVMKLLPLNLDAFKEDLKLPKSEEDNSDDIFIYEPSPRDVFNILVSKYVKGIVYGTLVEAFASEQSARMTSMDSATSNADEMLQSLNLYYNRARQAAITQEISEIVGGASVIK
jgi:F-type H+-transporting ATPase subunit gamma